MKIININNKLMIKMIIIINKLIMNIIKMTNNNKINKLKICLIKVKMFHKKYKNQLKNLNRKQN
jgi:hypothetical protein